MNDKNQKKGEINARLEELSDQLKTLSNKLEKKLNEKEKLMQRLAESEDIEERVQRAGNVQVVLKDYRDELRRKKLQELSQTATKHFKNLIRKEDFVEKIIVDPEDYSIQIENQEGTVIPHQKLSAGEKQICVTSLLWGLRDVSSRPLPIIVDTPLSRLDDTHRRAILTQFFPNVSHQVVLLPTDAEVSQEDVDQLEPFFADVMTLQYQESENYSEIHDGFFEGREDKQEVEVPA
ncbi:MAG: hypothetical protein ABEH43_06800 [Flavobacteriales bacterium]